MNVTATAAPGTPACAKTMTETAARPIRPATVFGALTLLRSRCTGRPPSRRKCRRAHDRPSAQPGGRRWPLDFRSSGWLRRCCGPGPEHSPDFGVGGLSWVCRRKTGRYQGPAELDDHVFKGRLGLFGVPRLLGAAGVDVGRVVAVPGVPADDQGVDEQRERDGPLDGFAGPVAGLAGSQHVA